MKSWLVGGRSTGETFAAGTTGFFQIGTSIETDQVSTIRVFFPEDLTARNWAVRCAANTLSGTCTVVIRKNDTTDTALTVTFNSGETNVEKRLTGVDVSFLQDDDWVGKVVCEAGTGSITLLLHSVEIEPDNPNSTLSFFGIKQAGSSAITTNATTFFPPFGRRSTDAVEVFAGTESTGVDWECIGAFTAVYFHVATGTVDFDGTMTARTRKNAANGGSSITILGSDDQVVLVDTAGSDTLADGDKFNYAVVTSGGTTGTLNIESMSCWLRSANGQFLMAIGERTGLRINADITRYWHMQGEGIGSHATEAPSQMTAPFDMTILQLEVLSDRERNTSTASTVTLRVNGSSTGLAVSIPASGGAGVSFGLFEDSDTIAIVGGTDLLDTEMVVGDGTNRDWNYVVYLVEADAAGPDLVSIDGALSPGGGLDVQVFKAFSGATSPAGTVSQLPAKPVSGALSPAGALVREPLLDLEGINTPSGALANAPARLMSGATTPAGALLKQPQSLHAGVLTSSGALTRKPLIELQGMDTPFGDLAADALQARVFTGALAPNGALAKRPAFSPTGDLSLAGSILKMPGISKVGEVSSSGAFSSLLVVVLDLDGSISFAGALSHEVGLLLSGVLSANGDLANLSSTTEVIDIDGEITPAGDLLKLAPVVISGSLSPDGTFALMVDKLVSGEIAPTGADLHFKVSVLELDGAIDSSGLLSFVTGTKFVEIAGELDLGATLLLQPVLELGGVLNPLGALANTSQLGFLGVLTPEGQAIVFRVVVLEASGVLTLSGLLVALPIVEIPQDVSLTNISVRTPVIHGLKVVHKE